MDSAQTLPAENTTQRRLPLNWDIAATILWESAWNALIRAFIVRILGSIAISLLGDVLGEMTPSLPPGFGHKPAAEAQQSPVLPAAGRFISQNSFWIIFGVLYVVITTTQFARYSRVTEHRRFVARLLRISRRISGHWFSLFVVNAFTAWVTTIVIAAVQNFSWTQILWSVFGSLIRPVVDALASVVPGSGFMGRWYSWYGQNHIRFMFWLLYSAAICDDLGVPNYKTLLRWSARRLKHYILIRSSWLHGVG